jgi:hypothetical protein
VHYIARMAKVVKNGNAPNLTIRPTAEDKKLIAILRKRLGVEVSQIIRLGLRALAAKEGVSA